MELPNRRLIRLPGYDYSQSGYYFITICTQNRKCIFGNIIDNKMILNDSGLIMENAWDTLPQRYPVELDIFQIMPNHLHFIICILQAGYFHPTLGQIIAYFKYESTKRINFQSYGRGLPARLDMGAKTAPLRKFIKIWQRNYYEHIIRNETELNKIRKYIEDNPLNWREDENNPSRITKGE